MSEKKISQVEKIIDLRNIVAEAKILLFFSSNKINKWEIKLDRKLLKKKWFNIYKTNIYRGEQVFNKIPMFKFFLTGIHCYFFVAYSKNIKRWKKIVDAFKLPLKYLSPLFVIQNKTFVGKERLSNILALKNKSQLAVSLVNNKIYILVKCLFLFLANTIRPNQNKKLIAAHPVFF